jgi:dienelactone hydrolase
MLRIALLKISVVALVLAAAGCVATQSPLIKRPSGEAVPIRLDAYPLGKSGPAPTVIVAHGSGGVSAMHRAMASTLNDWGYNAVVIDHYTLRGISAPHAGVALHGARGEDRALDFIEAAHWIRQQDWHRGKIAVVGFSQGGGGVLALVNDRILRNLDYVTESRPNPISVAVAFYPSCAITSPPMQPSMPTQVHLAEKDDLAYISACGFGRNSPYEVHLYQGATHSFDENIPTQAVLRFTHRYSHAATQESRVNLRRFLDANMGK